jgi:seryl-tRNA synthetase
MPSSPHSPRQSVTSTNDSWFGSKLQSLQAIPVEGDRNIESHYRNEIQSLQQQLQQQREDFNNKLKSLTHQNECLVAQLQSELQQVKDLLNEELRVKNPRSNLAVQNDLTEDELRMSSSAPNDPHVTSIDETCMTSLVIDGDMKKKRIKLNH